MPRDLRELQELVRNIDEIVESATAVATLPDADLRRVLRFIAQVVQVVEQAFQDVLGVLVELSQLEPADLSNPGRLHELRASVGLLTARSHYRDAAEICSRLKYLGDNFNQFVRPSVSHLPEFRGWHGIFELIEHREGRIIMLVEESAQELDILLAKVDPSSLGEVRAIASGQVMELRSLLGELHDLNGRILGYSGRPGFLELTADRQALQKEVKIMVDNRDQSVTHGHRVAFGNGATVSGSVVVATNVQDSIKTIQTSTAAPLLKTELELLCSQVEELLLKLPEGKRVDVKQDLSSLVSEATKEAPRRKWYQLSADGLVEAAKACGAIAGPVVETVKKIVSMLGG